MTDNNNDETEDGVRVSGDDLGLMALGILQLWGERFKHMPPESVLSVLGGMQTGMMANADFCGCEACESARAYGAALVASLFDEDDGERVLQ